MADTTRASEGCDKAAEAIARLMYNSAGGRHDGTDWWATDPPEEAAKARWIAKSMELVVAAEPHIRRATLLEAADRAWVDTEVEHAHCASIVSTWLRERAES